MHAIEQATGKVKGSPSADAMQMGMYGIAGYMYYTFAKDAVALATLWFGEYIEAFDSYSTKKH